MLFLLFLLPSFVNLHAELLWNNEDGWYATGKDIEAFDKLPDEALDIMCSARLAQEKGDSVQQRI